jgi:hypothetical protein
MHPSRLRLAASATALALTLAACGDSDDGASVRELDGEGAASASGSASGSGSGSASGSGSGSASGSHTGSASGSASATASGTSATLGGYTPVSDVDAHSQVVLDVCEINEALPSDGAVDAEAVRRAYAEGGNSLSGDGSARTLQGFATGERDEPLWNTAEDHFGSSTFLDDFVGAAIDGTGTFADEPDGVRRQAIQKGTQNHIMMMWVFHELDAAAEKVAAGETDPEAGAPHNVDEAWAFYHGAEPSCAPFATASKRGENFGTGESVNQALLAAAEDLRDAAVDGDQAAFDAAYDTFVAQALVPYVQAAVRYAQLTADDLAGGDSETARVHQAEGLAFWRVVAPYVAAVDAAAADEVDAVFDLANDPAGDGGDTVRTALEGTYDGLGITAEQVGTLQE